MNNVKWMSPADAKKVFCLVCRPKAVILTLVLTFFLCYSFVISNNQGHHRSWFHPKHNSLNVQHDEDDVIDGQQDDQSGISRNKIILYWTGFYDRKDMSFGFGQDPFVQASCPVSHCWATEDRSLLNQSDAVIFHAIGFDPEDLPDQRHPDQVYIFYLLETLPYSRLHPSFSNITDGFFNWTMTYRRDSDIYLAQHYGALRRKSGSVGVDQLPSLLSPGVRQPLPEVLMTRHPADLPSLNKTKMIAWFCSHTPTYGLREEYVRELSRFVPVDVYGKCGNLSCEPRNSAQCDLLLADYKFYFAAENSLCPDYVTEKFYRALEMGVVPIVYGGADYDAYAPPHSFIHVADFSSPKDLADYLRFLDSNEAMYSKYFQWKADWEVVKRPLNGWCDLCEKLNSDVDEHKSYDSVAKWWYDQVPCYPGSSYIQTVRSTNNASNVVSTM